MARVTTTDCYYVIAVLLALYHSCGFLGQHGAKMSAHIVVIFTLVLMQDCYNGTVVVVAEGYKFVDKQM